MAVTLLAGLALTPAIAQEDASGSDNGGLSIGTPAEAADGIGQTYVAATHGDWETRCIRVEEGQPEPCQLYQLLVDASGNAVAEVNVFDLPDTDQVVAGAAIITPLETLLTPQLRLQVDDAQPLVYPFSFCTQIGCFVRIGLTEDNLAAYRRGSEAIITIVPVQAPDQTVALTMSLSGFTAGFEDVSERLAAAQALQTDE